MNVVFHAGPLSEFMLLMPLMRALQQPVTVVAPWQRASLAKPILGATAMDIELFEFTRLHAQGGPSRVSPAIDDLFKFATHIVSFLSAEQDNWADNVQRLAPDAKLLRNAPRPPANCQEHFTDWHRGQLLAQGLSLRPTPPERLNNPKGPIVIHAGSSAMKRCWPVERFEALIRALRAEGLNIHPVFGEVELQRWSPQRVQAWTEELGAEPFHTTEALLPCLEQARLFIGNDAGPMHLAAQLGVPTCAILGPTDPAKTGPQADHVHFITPPDGPDRIEQVELSAVLDAVGLRLAT